MLHDQVDREPTKPAIGHTTTVPIVFVSGEDPIRSGLVDSLNRPGGNVTGVTFLSGPLAAKQMGLLHELVPGAAVIAVLLDPNYLEFQPVLQDVEGIAKHGLRREGLKSSDSFGGECA
jgi:ABC-type uncharacterized transport system substrate-binding protein